MLPINIDPSALIYFTGIMEDYQCSESTEGLLVFREHGELTAELEQNLGSQVLM